MTVMAAPPLYAAGTSVPRAEVQARTSHYWSIPVAWVAVLTFAFAIPFSRETWPFGDTYTVLFKASSLNWRDAFVDAFGRGVEYRPFFSLLVKLLYATVGLRLWFYKGLVLAQFSLILLLLIRLMRPDSSKRMLASLVAISVAAGLHSSQILFSFFPVNHHSLVMLLVLSAATLALDPPRDDLEWPFALLTLCGLFFIEFGLIIPPMLTILYLAGARGTTRKGVIGSWLAFAIYALVRFSLGTQQSVPLVHGDTGIGFERLSPAEILATFENAHWLFFAYNIVATLLTVIASEPRSGRFHFIETQLHGNTPIWLWFHVLSSLATTAFIVWRLSRPGLTLRDRQLAWLALTLIVLASGLGFLYARDRIALPAGLGYALLLYLAVARLLEETRQRSWARSAATATIGILLTAWLVRDVETWFFVRDAAWDRHREWTDRFTELGGYKRPQTPLLMQLRRAALRAPASDPREDPSWTYLLFERRYDQ
jgi:hypothetical protein